MVLDEPSSNLDSEGDAALFERAHGLFMPDLLAWIEATQAASIRVESLEFSGVEAECSLNFDPHLLGPGLCAKDAYLHGCLDGFTYRLSHPTVQQQHIKKHYSQQWQAALDKCAPIK